MKIICEILLKTNRPSQLFTKLSVSTIGRSDNIDDLLLSNIEWENDGLTIIFGNTKSDIEGDSTSEKKRLFANPFSPEICVILALAIYTFCKCWMENNKYLFDGGDQNKRYYRQLLKCLKELPEHVKVGCEREEIGTHSARKFAESTSTNKVDGPSKTMVCLRAGQSVGRTQDCYLKAEQAELKILMQMLYPDEADKRIGDLVCDSPKVDVK